MRAQADWNVVPPFLKKNLIKSRGKSNRAVVILTVHHRFIRHNVGCLDAGGSTLL